MQFISRLLKDLFKSVIIGLTIAAVVMLIAWGTGLISYKMALSDFNRDLTVGMEGKDVKKLEKYLTKINYLEREVDELRAINPIAKYDDKTKEAVELFQDDKGINVTGNADQTTIRALLKDLKIFSSIRNSAYYLSIIGLMLSVGFFVKRDATRPLDFESQWKDHFSVFNLALVIMFVSLTIGFVGMLFQSAVF